MKRIQLIQMLAFLGLAATLTLTSLAQAQQNKNFLTGWTQETPKVATDISKAVSRGYLVPSIEAVPGGAKITVEVYHDRLNSGVALFLQMVINDGNGAQRLITLQQLSPEIADNPVDYYSKREFIINYDDLNRELMRVAPNAPGVRVQPGLPLYVYGKWAGTHQWGGPARQGGIFLPSNAPKLASAPVNASTSSITTRPTDLDLGYKINQQMVNMFNDRTTGAGLLKDGQVRSRVEGEGKFQVDLKQGEFKKIRARLFQLAQDPAEAAKLLGPDWTIKLVDRYMDKDAATGALVLDSEGFPIPDPMVDTYYDNDKLDAAKNDIGIRYRYTKGNNSGAWNFKPGMGVMNSEGVVFRTEFGLDTTDNKPSTVAKFVDSTHPLNFFSRLRDLIPGSTPSEFLKPAVLVHDNRYKFLLEHKNKLAIEVSVDGVTATDLRDPSKAAVQFGQLEMDVEHLATGSLKVATTAIDALGGSDLKSNEPWLATIGADAFFDGRQQIHNDGDLQPGSPILTKHASDFTLATDVIKALRSDLIGANWVPGGQKYAFAARELGMTSAHELSPSLKRMRDVMAQHAHTAAVCPVVFDKK